MIAYNFDSEFTIYSKADRIKVLEEIADDKLGVPKTMQASSVIPIESIGKIYLFNQTDRSLVPLDSKAIVDAKMVFYKYLIVFKKDETCGVLYNTSISLQNNYKMKVRFEMMLSIPEVYEAMRLVESSVIDIELESRLKELYGNQHRTLYPVD